MKQNFAKTKGKAPRKISLNTIKFYSSTRQVLPYFQPFFIAWIQVNKIQ